MRLRTGFAGLSLLLLSSGLSAQQQVPTCPT